MKILGISPRRAHDTAAALIIDGKVIAAAEEERFCRIKHAKKINPVQSIKFCLDYAGLKMSDIDVLAIARSPELAKKQRWRYAKRMANSYPKYGLKNIKRTTRISKDVVSDLKDLLACFNSKMSDFDVRWIPHHDCHMSSVYHLSGWDNAAVMSIDGRGEFDTTVLAEGKNGEIIRIKDFIVPDSLGFFYSVVTRHLGFQPNNGEFKVMGMSPYGDPSKIDLSELITFGDGTYKINEHFMWPLISMRRHDSEDRARDMVDLFGPRREGDGLSEPYIHIAAAAQQVLEDCVIDLVKTHLTDVLKRTNGRLCFAGGTALNVRLNRKLLDLDEVNELFVQPAANDGGTAIGAASHVAKDLGEKLEKMPHAYLGPEYSNQEIKEVLDKFKLPYRKFDNIEQVTAKLLAAGKIISWLQGRMEYGPRALGNRSILANPSTEGIADEVNGRIKFRENWRPFCPSILEERAPEIIDTKHNSDYMTFSFIVNKEWAEKVPEIVHVDGSARPQTVKKETNQRFHKLISEFEKLTGLPIVLNTSLNRRGEPMVCSPEDAITMFYQCGLEYLVMGDFLIPKSGLFDEFS